MALLVDGYKTTINLTADLVVLEIEVTPPAIDGGEPIPQDHMQSGFLSIFFPRKRRRLAPFTLMVAWNSFAYNQITQSVTPNAVAGMIASVNKNQSMTITFSDGATLSFWGFVSKFEPGTMKDGERPTATLTIVPSLLDCYNIIRTPIYTAGISSTVC